MDPRISTPSSIRPASPATAWRLEIQDILSYPLMTTTEAFQLLCASLKRWQDSGKDGAPRPPNKFILYRTHVQSLRGRTRGKRERQTDASREIGDIWRQASSGERDYYGKLATWSKFQHERLVPNYKYDPKRKRKQHLLATGIEQARPSSLGRANHQDIEAPTIGASSSRSRGGRSLGARPQVQHGVRVPALSLSLGPQDRWPAPGSGRFLRQSTYVAPRTWDAASASFAPEPGPNYGASPLSNSGGAVQMNSFAGGAPNPAYDHHAVGQPHEPVFFLNPQATSAAPASYSPDYSTPTSLNSLPTPPLVVASGPAPAIFECPVNVHPAPPGTMQGYISPQGLTPTSFGSHDSSQTVFSPSECAANSAIPYAGNSFVNDSPGFPVHVSLSPETYLFQLRVAGIPDALIATIFSMAT